MKKIAIAVIAMFLALQGLSAQEPVTFSKVIQTDSVGKDVIYARLKSWIATNFVSAKTIIDLDDKENGVIVIKYLEPYLFKGMSYQCYTGNLAFTLKISIKANRFKVDYTNITHQSNNIYHNCELGILTNDSIHTTKGMSKMADNKVWVDLKMKAEGYVMAMNKNLEEATRNLKSKSEDDNW